MTANQDVVAMVTWGMLSDFYGVECPGDREIPIIIYKDEEGYHTWELDDVDWAPTSSEQVTELLDYVGYTDWKAARSQKGEAP